MKRNKFEQHTQDESEILRIGIRKLNHSALKVQSDLVLRAEVRRVSVKVSENQNSAMLQNLVAANALVYIPETIKNRKRRRSLLSKKSSVTL